MQEFVARGAKKEKEKNICTDREKSHRIVFKDSHTVTDQPFHNKLMTFIFRWDMAGHVHEIITGDLLLIMKGHAAG